MIGLLKHPWEVEIPAEKSPQFDMDVHGEKDQDRIKEILDFQLRDKISKKENEIRRVLEGLIEGKILKQRLSSSDFDFHNLDQFVGEVISKHAPNSAPNDPLQKKHKYISWLLTQLVHIIGTPFLRLNVYKAMVGGVSPRCGTK